MFIKLVYVEIVKLYALTALLIVDDGDTVADITAALTIVTPTDIPESITLLLEFIVCMVNYPDY